VGSGQVAAVSGHRDSSVTAERLGYASAW
jgi:hypothetical protein